VNEEEVEEEESLFIDEDGPAIHVDNDDIEEFRPLVPPVVEEVIVPEKEPEPLPVVEQEEKKEDDLDFTYKVADVADEVIEEEPTPVSREIKANDLVEQFGLYDPTADLPKYQFPTIDLLKEYDQKNQTSQVTMDELKANKEKIVETLLNYGIGIQKIDDRTHGYFV
jgi:S-DNA-T family DNA segregation ATPase FtsK/SpoIIIE